METVKLMIELPKEIYNLCVDNELLSNDDYKVTIWESIANGTIISECKTDDCISKIEVIDYLCKHCPDDGECFKDCDEIKHLRNMPSVTPQPRKGHWILRNSFLVPYKCSECNYESERYDNYCPNCGADVREVKE